MLMGCQDAAIGDIDQVEATCKSAEDAPLKSAVVPFLDPWPKDCNRWESTQAHETAIGIEAVRLLSERQQYFGEANERPEEIQKHCASTSWVDCNLRSSDLGNFGKRCL